MNTVRTKFYPTKSLRHVAHISDIHIPLGMKESKRYDAFVDAFASLDISLRGLERVDAIVVTGDVLHVKFRLEPDTVLLARRLFEMLAAVAPVFVIAGNHDILEPNLDQTCTLSVVTDGLEHVTYLAYSGVYEVGSNVLFVVSSLKDGKFIYRRDVADVTDKCVVALYHGTIQGVRAENGRVIGKRGGASSRFRAAEDFAGFDYVMLGDIHKQQSVGRSDSTIAYAGSLLQLNIGEDIDNHGYLLWDLAAKDPVRPYVFYPIRTRYGFAQLRIESGALVETDVPSNMPERPIVVCRVVDLTTPAQLESCKRVIQERFRPLKMLVESSFGERAAKRPRADDNTNAPRRSSDADLIKRLAPSEHYEALIELHSTIQARVASYQTPCERARSAGITWSVSALEFMNMFVYGKSVVNRIELKDGVTNISAPNRYGKSSIVNMMLFALFDRCGGQHGHVLNKAEQEGYVTLRIRHGNDDLEITKSLNRRADREQCKTTFVNLTTGMNLACGSVTETVAAIQKYVGRPEDFMTDNVLGTRSPSIVDMTPMERLRYMQRLFDVDKYQAFANCAKVVAKTLSTVCTELRGSHRALGEQLVREFSAATPTRAAVSSIQDEITRITADQDEAVICTCRARKEMHDARARMVTWAPAEKFIALLVGDQPAVVDNNAHISCIQEAEEAYAAIQSIVARRHAIHIPATCAAYSEPTPERQAELAVKIIEVQNDISFLSSVALRGDDAWMNPEFQKQRDALQIELTIAQRAHASDITMAAIEKCFARGSDGINEVHLVHTGFTLTRTVENWVTIVGTEITGTDVSIDSSTINALQAELRAAKQHECATADLYKRTLALKRTLKERGDTPTSLATSTPLDASSICDALTKLTACNTCQPMLHIHTRLRDDAVLAISDQELVRTRYEFAQAAQELEHMRQQQHRPAIVVEECLNIAQGRCELVAEYRRLQSITMPHRTVDVVSSLLADINAQISNAYKTQKENNRTRHEQLGMLLTALRSEASFVEAGLLDMQLKENITRFKNTARRAVHEYRRALADVAEFERQEREAQSRIDAQRDIVIAKRLALQREESSLERYQKLSTDSESTYAALVSKESQLALYNLYIALMSPKGVPLQLLETYSNIAAAQINEILQVYTPYRISLHPRTGGETRSGATNDELQLEIHYNGETPIAASRLSGAESAVLSVAVKSVCARMRVSISGSTTSTIAVADEAFDCVDKASWATVLETVFGVLRTTFTNVLCISHRNVPFELVESEIVLANDGEASRVITVT